MADVRSMLKASREARKLAHPHASYTKDGKLTCNLCETLIKTEAAWQAHLHSTQHTLRLSRAQDAAASRNGNANSKKRKASAADISAAEGPKRAKPAMGPSDLGGHSEDDHSEDDHDGEGQGENGLVTAGFRQTPAEGNVKEKARDDEQIDPTELAALDKELADLEASMPAGVPSLQGETTISAPPMSAEQLAAQAREEESAQQGSRDMELEAEREDAVRNLEDEFVEMEELEDRFQKLRDRRDALRNAQSKIASSAPHTTGMDVASGDHDGEEDNYKDEEDEDEEGEELDDGWNFGSS